MTSTLTMAKLWTKPSSPVETGLWTKPISPVESNSPEGKPLSHNTTRQRNPGRRIAQIVKLKPECVDMYKEVHANVWPEVLRQIKACNIQDCESRLALPRLLVVTRLTMVPSRRQYFPRPPDKHTFRLVQVCWI